jgi:chromosome segregation ATPase
MHHTGLRGSDEAPVTLPEMVVAAFTGAGAGGVAMWKGVEVLTKWRADRAAGQTQARTADVTEKKTLAELESSMRKELRTENELLRTRVGELEQVIQNTETSVAESFKGMKKLFADSQAENRQLIEELGTALSHVRILERDNASLKQANADLTTKFESALTRNVELEAALNRSLADNASMRADNLRLQQTAQQFGESAGQFAKRAADLEADVEQLTAALSRVRRSPSQG